VNRRTRLGSALAAALAATTLTACQTGSTQDAEQVAARTSVDDDAYPVNITHAYVRTTIEQEPERVATLGWSDQDNAVALGVVPVGATKLTWGGNERGSSDWFDARLAELGAASESRRPVRYDDSDGAPVEEIARLDPDVILATNSGITRQEYAKLSKIAPVVAYPEAPWTTPWQQSLEMVGKALGRSSIAEEVAAEAQAQIVGARQDHPELVGTSLIFGYLTTADLSTIGIYAPQDPRVSFLHDLGMVDAPAVADAIEPGQFYGTVSAERAGQLQSDVFLTWSESPGDLKTFADNPLIGRVPAIESGHAYAEDDKQVALAVTNPTPLSIPVIIEEFVPEVARAVAGS
jgi:iron complex transport system substrate-binding protein